LPGVVHEGGVVEDVDVAGAQRPHAEVVLLAVAQAEGRLVEGADGVQDLALDVEADPHSRRDPRILVPRALLHDAPEAVHVEARGHGIGREGTGQRDERRVVREGSDGGDGRVGVGGGPEFLQPAGRHLGVAVEENHVPVRRRHALVDAGHEPALPLVLEDQQPAAGGHEGQRRPSLLLSRPSSTTTSRLRTRSAWATTLSRQRRNSEKAPWTGMTTSTAPGGRSGGTPSARPVR
jgi:hypothetical protein